jgi:hypothetical protein
MEIDFHVEKRYQLLTLNSWVSGFLKFSIRYILLSCWLYFFPFNWLSPYLAGLLADNWLSCCCQISSCEWQNLTVCYVFYWVFKPRSNSLFTYLVENAFFSMYMTIYLPFLFSHGCISIIDLWLILHRNDVCGALVWRAFQWPYAREPRFLSSWGGKFCGFLCCINKQCSSDQ